jgi:hypothetical protein
MYPVMPNTVDPSAGGADVGHPAITWQPAPLKLLPQATSQTIRVLLHEPQTSGTGASTLVQAAIAMSEYDSAR